MHNRALVLSFPAPWSRSLAFDGSHWSSAGSRPGGVGDCGCLGGLSGLGFKAEKLYFYIPVSNQLHSGGAACRSKLVFLSSCSSK